MLLIFFLHLLGLLGFDLPAEKNVNPVEVVRVPSYCEGIVFDQQGNGYISHGKFITRVGPDGKASIWAETGSPDGHKVLGDSTHLARPTWWLKAWPIRTVSSFVPTAKRF